MDHEPSDLRKIIQILLNRLEPLELLIAHTNNCGDCGLRGKPAGPHQWCETAHYLWGVVREENAQAKTKPQKEITQ